MLSIAAAVAISVVTLELASWVLFRIITKHRFSYAAVAAERAYVIGEAGAEPAAPAPSAGPLPSGPAVPSHPGVTPEDLVPHPFAGFVLNPEGARIRQYQGQGAMPITELGFYQLPNPPPANGGLAIAIFGGSMAAHFCVDGRAALEQALQAAPGVRGRAIRVDCFAMGGYKQPQTAGALMYLLALGQRFDAVIELDGFNEVAVTRQEYNRGLFIAFPRNWDHLMAGVADREEQLRVGQVAYLLRQRARLARWFSRPPLAWSVTATLVWKSLHRFLSNDLARTRQQLAATSTQERDYRSKGPSRPYPDDAHLLAASSEVWGRASLLMHRMCRAQGIRYHHFLQPNQYVRGSKPMSAEERALAYREDHPYKDSVERGYPLLQAEGARLAAQGVPFHDLTGVFADRQEPLYIDECCHVSAQGSALMGQAIGRTIAPAWDR